jgi:tetratricopeptide (TPR) repeat protein
MIARNEGHIIEQAISSVAARVDEVIVVDTGSTDQTRDIVTRLGAKVLERPWDDDFSAPRNLSIQEAKSDWILVLDADEAIASEQLPKLDELIQSENVCYELTQRHYTNDHRLSDFQPVAGSFPKWERQYLGFFESSLVRLIPNNQGLHYQGRVHELVEFSIGQLKRHRIQRSGIILHHYGHTPEEMARKDKHSLYGQLGRSKLSDTPNDWKGYYELGVELNKPESREESVVAFRESLARNPSYLPTWINLGYVLCELGRLQESQQVLSRALQLDPTSSEAYCNLGVVCMRAADWKAAERCFKMALKLNPKYINAYLNLASTLAATRRISEAILSLERILELSPRHARAKAEIGALYLVGGCRSEARAHLEAALAEDGSLLEAKQNLALLS